MVQLSLTFPEVCSISPEGTVTLLSRMPTSTCCLFQYIPQSSQTVSSKEERKYTGRSSGDEEAMAYHGEMTEVRSMRY